MPLLTVVAVMTVACGSRDAVSPDVQVSYQGPLPPGAVFRLGRGAVDRIALSPDGELLAVGSHIGVYLYRTDTFEQVGFHPTEHRIRSLALSPDGTMLAVGEVHSNLMTVLDVSTGEVLYTQTGHADGLGICGLAYSPDGALLVSVSYDDKAIVRDAASGETLRIFEGNGEGINGVSFSPDGETLAMSLDTGGVYVLDAATGERLHVLEPEGQPSDLTYGVAYSPDGLRIASGAFEVALVWDTETGQQTDVFQGLEGRTESVIFSSDGSQLYAGSTDNTLKAWNLQSGDVVLDLKANAIDAAPDGSLYATASFGDEIVLWDGNTDERLMTMKGHSDSIWSTVYVPEDEVFVTGTLHGELLSWDVETGQPTRFAADVPSGPVYSAVLSPDGSMLATGHLDGQVNVWDARSGDKLFELDGLRGAVFGLAFSPDGSLLAGGARGQEVILWDVETRLQEDVLVGHDSVFSLAFHDDGMLAVGTFNDIHLWDVAAHRQLRVLQGHTDIVRKLAFSPDGTILAAASFDDTASLWDVETGKKLHTLSDGRGQDSGGLAFTPDASSLAISQEDGSITVWDVQDGELLHRYDEAHTMIAWDLTITPDGETLVSGSWDGTILFWDLDA